MGVSWVSGTTGKQACVRGTWETKKGCRTVAKKMVDGYPSNSFRGHYTIDGCIKEWQLHCALGEHAHPVDPTHTPSPSLTPIGKAGRRVDPQLQADMQKYCMPGTSSPSTYSASSSTLSSVTATSWAEVPTSVVYFALWRGNVVYTRRYVHEWARILAAKQRRRFFLAQAQGAEPSILCCADYDEAQAFAEGIHWIHD
ncbi:hypothetical protein C8F04DRAFT_1191384 [Mycena alexandri]|uniref:Uncharacterized protein n=1 Tax=Mycena alexandri TaxID=1745969 RepID=A0AAD6WW30_9AGAR|nr:hypothetical protein C8F04DRAFT_1191384 [Mycena alexandri]